MRALHAPLRPAEILLASLLIGLGVVAYCLAYTAYSGTRETIGEAVLWALLNVLPWIAAFEMCKRVDGWGRRAAILLAVGAGSALAGLLVGRDGDPMFELVRRVPGMLACAAFLAAADWRAGVAAARPGRPADLPLPPERIDWIASAGNYVELHSGGRTIVHRSSLAEMEARLARRGFVRIHRSALVRRDCVARWRGHDVILTSGLSLKVGKRYRSGVAERNLVPSSQSDGKPGGGRD